jgi:hypothetical protein
VIEVVIASTVSLVIVMALFAVVDSGTRAEHASHTKHEAFQELRGALSRASTDIRQATDVNPSSTSASLDIQTLVQGAPKRMIFSVAGSSFRRTMCLEANFDFASTCGGAPAELVANVTTALPFCYNPPDCSATAPVAALGLVRITIGSAPAVRSDTPVTLATEVQLRNL